MKLTNIPIKDSTAKKVYQIYIRRVQHSISGLSKSEQTDVIMEWNSHIFESMQRSEFNEMEALLDAIDKLGEPEIVLKPLVADMKMEQAVRSFNPIHIFRALVLNIGNGIAYIIFAILYLLLFTFIFLIVMKLLYPSEVGMFFKDGNFALLGMGYQMEGYQEVLGNWFVPVMLLTSALCYIIITLVLKLKRSFRKEHHKKLTLNK